MTREERFWAKVEKTDSCWIWVGARLAEGYGHFGWDGKLKLAHRLSYLMHHGTPAPENMTIDHLCRNRACVNPTHLEVVTNRENILRGIGPTAVNAAKTHCIHGHEFTPENTYWRTDGGRCCRTCRRAIDRRRRPRKQVA